VELLFDKEPWVHPCLKCGACCSTYRVTFLKSEIQSTNDPLTYLSVDNGGVWQAMPGTNKKHRPKCDYLEGIIGKLAKCGVYNNRPSPCRNFLASYEDGKTHAQRCDEARIRHGLKPLIKQDWKK
jgi:Fe-S-cluster containining protein